MANEKQSVLLQWEDSQGFRTQTGSVYTFDTKQEMDAFILGIDAGMDRLGCSQIKPGEDCPDCGDGHIVIKDDEFVCVGGCERLFE